MKIIHEALQEGDAFIIADAGGGTLDINTYEVVSADPLRIQELVKPDCTIAKFTVTIRI